MKEFIPPDENWENTKNYCLMLVVAILFILFVIWFVSCKPTEQISKGCFYYSRTHSLQLDSLMRALVVGSCKMTVDGQEYTLWTNDSTRLEEYKKVYPDTKFVDCYDNTKAIQQQLFSHD